MREELPEELKRELRKGVPEDFDERFLAFLEYVKKAIERLTRILTLLCESIVKKAEEKGVTVVARAVCCHIPRCGTCLGVHSYHFPYLYTKSSGNYSLVKTRDRHDFLSGIGLVLDDIELFEGAMDARHELIKFYHNSIRILGRTGLTDVELGEK